MVIDWKANPQQRKFFGATADEVLYGGAAGGGKSYGAVMDAFMYAMQYPKSKQLILRRTFPELEKSIIRVHLELYPRQLYRYNQTNHTGKFINGSIIDFFNRNDADADKYRVIDEFLKLSKRFSEKAIRRKTIQQ